MEEKERRSKKDNEKYQREDGGKGKKKKKKENEKDQKNEGKKGSK